MLGGIIDSELVVVREASEELEEDERLSLRQGEIDALLREFSHASYNYNYL